MQSNLKINFCYFFPPFNYSYFRILIAHIHLHHGFQIRQPLYFTPISIREKGHVPRETCTFLLMLSGILTVECEPTNVSINNCSLLSVNVGKSVHFPMRFIHVGSLSHRLVPHIVQNRAYNELSLSEFPEFFRGDRGETSHCHEL